MPLAPKLIAAAEDEWKRWGFSVSPLHKPPKIVGREGVAPYVGYVNDYWRVVGEPTWNGNTPQPWSAAFISFCFKTAGAGTGFPYRAAHAEYCRAILQKPASYPGLALADPAAATLVVGDLIWAARAGPDCPKPPMTHAEAISRLQGPDHDFCSHCDIVVELRQGEVDVLGGNVSNSVTRTTYATSNGHISDHRHAWLAVIKDTI
jgi:hypothetical protein